MTTTRHSALFAGLLGLLLCVPPASGQADSLAPAFYVALGSAWMRP